MWVAATYFILLIYFILLYFMSYLGYGPFPTLLPLMEMVNLRKWNQFTHIHTHKSQETNRSRSSCFLCPEFLCSWGLYHMSQWNLVLLKFLKVWFLSLANKRTPGDMKIKTNILSMQQISQTCDSLPELLICWDRKEEFGFLTWCYLFRGFGMSPKVFQSQFPHLQ